MYDYRLDDAGICNFEDDGEDEERKVMISYRSFMQPKPLDAFLLFSQSSFCLLSRSSGSAG